ncbi:MAG TPA: secretin N-terminal domain-containing protein, partial [Planctomycetaceae bacterium]|nr:secretin N-terminal domain-containing protein [Planctomycetaceae bacterium]
MIQIAGGVLFAGLLVLPALAQEAPGRGRPGGAPGAPNAPQGQPPGAPGAPGKPGENPGQPGEKPGEAKPPEPTKTTPRPQKPETPPNPDELKVQPDTDGMVRFSFQGQPWLSVLEWLAQISNLSLDWQEVPSDYLNLRTQRAYPVAEARDMINQHLLDRGFTLLRHGEVLRVVNIKKLDPSLVPRVRPADLENRDPHEFVKVSFPLDWLIAEKTVEELKPMLSPNGKMTALKSTNRLEAIDAVVNLRDIRDVLSDEQSNQGRERLVQEFRLEHVRAAEVLEQLQELLGLEKKPANAQPLSPEQQMMQQQQQMMRMQQQQQQGQQPAQKPKPEVHLVVNQRENSIIANAAADHMAVITAAVKVLDVPVDRSRSLLKNSNRVGVYRMAAIDPDALVKMLRDMGELDPTTRLEVDKKNRSIIVNGSLADHMMIRTLVTRLDGTDRKFEVIKLRRLAADYVAGTVEFMMGGGDKNKQQNNRYSPYFFDYGFGGRRNEQEDESRKFRVDADVENNRLLLWANEIELTEIQHLLVKLGEVTGPGGNPATLRVLDTIDPEEADELLRRLQKTWPGIAPNPLEISPGSGPRNQSTSPAEAEQAPRGKLPPKRLPEKTTDRGGSRPPVAAAPDAVEQLLRFVQVKDPRDKAEVRDDAAAPVDAKGAGQSDDAAASSDRGAGPAASGEANAEPPLTGGNAAEADGGAPSVEPPPLPPARTRPVQPSAPSPIRIGRGPDGRLIIASDDPAALDQFEDLVSQIAPQRKDFKVFRMKYKTTWAYGVSLNLKDFFEEDDKKKQNNRGWDYWGWGYRNDTSTDTTGRRLSKRRPLKFIADTDSNSIIVTGADQQQLKVIEELIALYDLPESKDPQAARLTKVVHVHYSKSRIIADALKEVYRDLLSVNDPAMQQQNQKNDRTAERSYTYIYGGGGGGDDKKPETPVKFKGALSIGVDELSNTLIVSAGGGLLENVEDTIRALDEAALATVPRLKVFQLDRNIDVGEVQQR